MLHANRLGILELKMPSRMPRNIWLRVKSPRQLKAGKCAFVFPSSAKTAFTGFGKSKAALDKAVLDAMRKAAEDAGDDPTRVETPRNWTLHDLRRTAKTLMQRAGVRPDISERVLGHVIGGVRGTYDRHDFRDEKRDALEKLARQFDWIIHRRIISVTLQRVTREAEANG